ILKKSSQEFMRYVEDTEATICGSYPISILLDMLPEEARGSLLIYYTSGDVLGDETDTVSYASIAFENAAGWG
ncbi:MAG: AmmeMemoRadiSam system protein B, partial [Desulfatiglandaceae bacterium]